MSLIRISKDDELHIARRLKPSRNYNVILNFKLDLTLLICIMHYVILLTVMTVHIFSRNSIIIDIIILILYYNDNYRYYLCLCRVCLRKHNRHLITVNRPWNPMNTTHCFS